MKIFQCGNCHQPLFFENRSCQSCGYLCAYNDASRKMVSFPKNEITSILNGSSQDVKLCKNYELKVCNWLVTNHQTNGYCNACTLNRTIPNLVSDEIIKKWKRLEYAKHRLIYQLQRLDLPLPSKTVSHETGLCFDFIVKGDRNIYTGHANGVITILLAEADSVNLEKVRKQLLEPYRTLIGHFRHEVGHYFWERLVRSDDNILKEFRSCFGDERPDYSETLNEYYKSGPRPNWKDDFITKYASSHPWEDWAETWAHYLHIIDTVETAYNFGLSVSPVSEYSEHMNTKIDIDPYIAKNFKTLIESCAPLFFAVNSINRSMGIKDVYPFIHNPSVVKKLKFIHDMLHP
ncbi:MAG: putative zinc-binding metallopeptidase [Fulvivirga sp.]|uniref:zinc-binding metallopeptidase family protein n=1 Tax=Fulvivirga sp. TaxID=1931237 RepID=UPI0032EF1FBC